MSAGLPTCEQVARAFLGPPAKRQGTELVWHCPNHDDRHPSLKINPKKNAWLCGPCDGSGNAWGLSAFITSIDPSDKPAITQKLRELGLLTDNGRKQDSRDVKKKPVRAEWVRKQLEKEGFHVVAEYKYGVELRKVRFEKPANPKPQKTFRWEHRKGDSWWAGNGGKAVPLYANKLFWERDQVEIALGVESEQKADIASELGIPAFSFKELIRKHCHHFAGITIVLWPDKDDSASKQATKKARILSQSKQPKSVCLITPPAELPEKGDIVDAVRRLGWGREQIEKLINEATPFSEKLDDATPVPGTPAVNWTSHLIVNQQGNPKPILANAITALRYATEWRGVLAFNEFSIGTVALKAPRGTGL